MECVDTINKLMFYQSLVTAKENYIANKAEHFSFKKGVSYGCEKIGFLCYSNYFSLKQLFIAVEKYYY